MDDGGRRCALTGCDRAIPTTEGRPERRYCSAAHRAAARQARRASLQAGQRDRADRLAEALPWLPEPDQAPAVGPVRPVEAQAAEPRCVVRPRDRRAPRPGGRVLAMLGVAGILVGGYAAIGTQPEPPPPSPVQAIPEGEPVDAWAQRATVALTSVNRELDLLAQAEEEWRRLPEDRRAVVLAPVVALEERRSVLQQRRATLRSQLDAYRSLRRAQQELAISEQQLRGIEKALADAPPEGRRSAGQEAAIAALDEQRDLRLRRRDVQRAELDSLQDAVVAATTTPLPDDGEVTAEVSRDVLDVVRTGSAAPTRPAEPSPPPPDVGAGRDELGTDDPPRDESEERQAAREKPGAASRPEEAGGGEPDAGATGESGPVDPDPAGPMPSAPVPGPDEEDASPDTLAELRERALKVAREARKAEAARRQYVETTAP